jgi:hypothetical protein
MEIRYMVNKEQIAAIRDYLLDLDCPFNESAVNAMCDLALKGLESPEARESIIQECRTACLEVGQQAHEAAKAKDATDYIAGYQDCAVDIDEELRALLQPQRVQSSKGDTDVG